MSNRVLLSGLLLALLAAGPATSAASRSPGGELGAALKDIQQRDFSSAIQVLRAFLKTNPQAADGHFLLGIALTELGRLEAANQHFAAARRSNPKLAVALRAQGMNEFNLGRAGEAEAHLKQFLQVVPGDELANMFLARIAFSRGDLTQALSFLDRAPNLVKADSPARLLLAEIHLKSGNTADGARILESIAAEDAHGAFEAGLVCAKYGLYAEAIPLFLKTVAEKPDFEPARYNLALAYFNKGKLEEARDVLTNLVQQNTVDFEILNLQADIEGRLSRVEEALALRRKILKIYPDEPRSYVSIVVLCINTLNYDLGLEIVQNGLRRIPQSIPLLTLRALLHTLKGQNDRAEADYRTAIRLQPSNERLQLGLAACLIDGWRPQEALPILRRLRAHGSDDYFAYHLLGEALVQLGVAPKSPYESEAFRSLQTAVRLRPDFVPPRVNLAKIYRRRGENDEALIELQKVIEQDPNNTTAYNLCAQIYREQNRLEDAQRMIAAVNRLNAEKDSNESKISSTLSELRVVLTKALDHSPQ